MKTEEKIVIILVVGIIVFAFFQWGFSSSGVGNLDNLCSPDFLGECN